MKKLDKVLCKKSMPILPDQWPRLGRKPVCLVLLSAFCFLNGDKASAQITGVTLIKDASPGSATDFGFSATNGSGTFPITLRHNPSSTNAVAANDISFTANGRLLITTTNGSVYGLGQFTGSFAQPNTGTGLITAVDGGPTATTFMGVGGGVPKTTADGGTTYTSLSGGATDIAAINATNNFIATGSTVYYYSGVGYFTKAYSLSKIDFFDGPNDGANGTIVGITAAGAVAFSQNTTQSGTNDGSLTTISPANFATDIAIGPGLAQNTTQGLNVIYIVDISGNVRLYFGDGGATTSSWLTLDAALPSPAVKITIDPSGTPWVTMANGNIAAWVSFTATPRGTAGYWKELYVRTPAEPTNFANMFNQTTLTITENAPPAGSSLASIVHKGSGTSAVTLASRQDVVTLAAGSSNRAFETYNNRQPAAPFTCANGITYQVTAPPGNGSSTLTQYNINTGVSTDLAALKANINAIGYGSKTNLLWGMSVTERSLASIDAAGLITNYDVPNMPNNAFNSAAIIPGAGATGEYLLLYTPAVGTTQQYYVVDIDPASPNYLRLVNPTAGYTLAVAPDFGTTLTPGIIQVADLTYLPSTQMLYGVVTIGDAANSLKLATVNPTTGAVTYSATPITGQDLTTANSNFGSMFQDASDNIYGYHNTLGAIYRINRTTLAATKLSTPGAVSSNDGASCLSALLSYSISGGVFNDANGMSDNNVNGTGFNPGALKAILYNTTTGTVAAVVDVATDGTYTFPATPGNAYTVYISTVTATVGQTAVPVVTLPATWASTGEHLGATPGSDGSANGTLTIGAVNADVTAANFGMAHPPATTNNSLTNQPAGSAATVLTILANDTEGNGGTLSTDSISLVTPAGATGITTDAQGDITGFTVTGEGTWVLNANGSTTFTPQAGFTADPTSISYTVTNLAGLTSPSATISIDYNAPLPVQWLYFTAMAAGSNVQLQWATAMEKNTDYFEAEYATDGTHFRKLGQVAAAGNSATVSKYSLKHEQAASLGAPVLLYRIRQVDRDGSYTYSAVRTVQLQATGQAGIKVYPNPVSKGGSLTVTADQINDIQVVNASGTSLWYKEYKGANVVVIPLGQWAAGTYMIRMNGGQQVTRFVIK